MTTAGPPPPPSNMLRVALAARRRADEAHELAASAHRSIAEASTAAETCVAACRTIYQALGQVQTTLAAVQGQVSDLASRIPAPGALASLEQLRAATDSDATGLRAAHWAQRRLGAWTIHLLVAAAAGGVVHVLHLCGVLR